MHKLKLAGSTLITAILAFQGFAQPPQQDLPAQFAAVRSSVSSSLISLRQYKWSQHIDISYKGDVKKSTDYLCRYDADGNIAKSLVGTPPPPPQLKGLKKRKADDLKDYMERSVTLMEHYVPPSLALMESSFKAGNASLGQAAPGMMQIQFKSYMKQGDNIAFNFDSASKTLRTITVNTYLEDPKDDPVTLAVEFATLPDDTNHIANATLTAKAKKITVKAANANYSKLNP